jgi:hypothetical protein
MRKHAIQLIIAHKAIFYYINPPTVCEVDIIKKRQ